MNEKSHDTRRFFFLINYLIVTNAFSRSKQTANISHRLYRNQLYSGEDIVEI